MAFNKPTLTELQSRIAADIERHTNQSASNRGDIYFGIARAHAGACYGLHGHLDYNRDQLFDDSASDESLLKRAAEMGIYQIAAIRASGTATIPGTDGEVVKARTIFTLDDTTYITTADATVAAGIATLSLQAFEAGAAGNLAAGQELTIFKTQANIDTTATIVEMSGGADVELIARVRERLRQRRQNPPMGGNEQDYIAWAKAAHPDVTRAWVYSNESGLGTVVLRFVTDNLASPIPTPAIKQAVFDYIDQQRPTGMAGFSVASLTVQPVDIVFTSLTPNTTAVQQAVVAEISDYITRESTPGGVLKISQLTEAISLASGETDHVITTTQNIQATSKNHLLVLGNVTFPV